MAHLGDGVLRSVQIRFYFVRLFPVLYLDFSVRVRIERGGKGLSAALGNKLRVNRPVFLRLELADFVFSVHDDAQRYGLDTPRGKSSADFLRDKGTELIAHQPVENPPRLLRVDPVDVDAARMAHTVLHTCFGDLIELHSLAIILGQPENVREVPRNRLSLAVGVGREINIVAFFGKSLQLLDELFLALDDIILRRKMVFDVHAETRLRQIAHVSHGRNYLEIATEIFFDCFGFGRRLHNNQI